MFMLLTAGPAAFFLGLAGSTAYSRPFDGPLAHAAAVCADYPNQAAAQRAWPWAPGRASTPWIDRSTR